MGACGSGRFQRSNWRVPFSAGLRWKVSEDCLPVVRRAETAVPASRRLVSSGELVDMPGNQCSECGLLIRWARGYRHA
jgi:hypothetical protein